MQFRHSLAPTGELRATINVGNPILAERDAQTGEVSGVSVDLARMLAERIGVPLKLIVLDSAGEAVHTVETGGADVGFFAWDPRRATYIAFTHPYILIEGCYLVRNDSSLETIRDVDRAGTRIVVGKGSAYDLFLTREIRRATIERAPTSPAVVSTLLESDADVAAGVRQQLDADATRVGGLRLLPGRFMVIEQAMGVARKHGSIAYEALSDFVESVKADGTLAEALARYGHEVSIAPSASIGK